MKTLALILLLFPVNAMAFKILYNHQGEQRLEEFGPGGTTNGEIVWNEPIDGELPKDAPVGYAERYEVEVSKTRMICLRNEKGEIVNVVDGKRKVCQKVEETYLEKQPRLRASAALKAVMEEKEKKEAEKLVKKERQRQRVTELCDILREQKAGLAELQELLLKSFAGWKCNEQ